MNRRYPDMALLFLHVKSIVVQDWSCKFIYSAQQNRGLSNFVVLCKCWNNAWKGDLEDTTISAQKQATAVSVVSLGYCNCDVPRFVYFLDKFLGSSV